LTSSALETFEVIVMASTASAYSPRATPRDGERENASSGGGDPSHESPSNRPCCCKCKCNVESDSSSPPPSKRPRHEQEKQANVDGERVPSEAHNVRLEGNALFKSAVAQMYSVNPFQFKQLMDKAINRYSDALKVATTAKDLSSLAKNLGVSHYKIAERFLAVGGFSEDVVLHVKRSLQFFDAARARVKKEQSCQTFEWYTDVESRVDEGAKLLWSSAREVRCFANYKSTKG
jgi:hypothetical protein